MITDIVTTFSEVIDWVGSTLTTIFSTSGSMNAVTPLVYIGVAMGVVGFGIKTIKSLAWGF